MVCLRCHVYRQLSMVFYRQLSIAINTGKRYRSTILTQQSTTPEKLREHHSRKFAAVRAFYLVISPDRTLSPPSMKPKPYDHPNTALHTEGTRPILFSTGWLRALPIHRRWRIPTKSVSSMLILRICSEKQSFVQTSYLRKLARGTEYLNKYIVRSHGPTLTPATDWANQKNIHQAANIPISPNSPPSRQGTRIS